jgi:peroxin-3
VGKANEVVLRLVPIPSTHDLRLSLQEPPKDGQDRYALWDHCKTQTFARLVVEVYGVVLLAAILRVQVNILGRYLYLESLIARDSSARMRIPLEVSIPQETQKRYLGYSEYLLHTGLTLLAAQVQHTAQRVLSGYPLQRQCTLEDVLAIIDAIRLEMEQPTSMDSIETRLNSFLLPQENTEDGCGGNGKRQRDRKLTMLLNETRDVLESVEFNRMLSRCLNLGFYTMSQQLHLCFPQQTVTRNLTLLDQPGAAELSVPMAKLMPLVNKQVSQLLVSSPSPFVDTLCQDEQLRQYDFDLFMAFAQ